MGVLNVTPDSFSDGGKYFNADVAVSAALAMIDEGADIIDIGGESTGPGSNDVSVDEELERVIPVIKGLRMKSDVTISIDTYKSEVARAAIDAGVDVVNDVTGLRGDASMVTLLVEKDVPVVIMYAKDNSPRTTSEARKYDDVVKVVADFLLERVEYAMEAGVKKENIFLDSGAGAFISSYPEFTLQLVNRMEDIVKLGYPVLFSPSRKSFIGQTLNLPVYERLEGTLAVCAVAVMKGVKILRVHDVKETRRVVDMVQAVIDAK